MVKEIKETVMLFCAHPDDEILGMGGTIAKYSKDGKEIIAVIFSYGEGSHPWMKKKFTIKTRVKESRRAGKIVGCKKTIFLALKDGSLTDETKKPKTIKMIKGLIKKYNPSKIFTHSFDDVIYKDHKAVYAAIKRVMEEINYKGDAYTFNIWNVTNIRKRNLPKMIVDASATFRTKLRALKEFKSQKVALVQLMPVVYLRGFKHGFEGNYRWGEKFYKIR